MSTFLSGKVLEEKLTDIIWEAKEYVAVMSPYIKLDDFVKKVFDKVKSNHEVHLILVFGKNEGYKQKSLSKEDFKYFKEFKNISILYNKDLHAKYYCNEKEGLITSLNLYDYSMINNIEFGISFTDNILNPTDKLFKQSDDFTNEIIFDKCEVVFAKEPFYSSSLLGLKKTYQSSEVLFDISEEFFNGKKYEVKYLKDIEDIQLEIENSFYEKPTRESLKKINTQVEDQNNGFCIRTGINIPFNPERPLCLKAYRDWNKFGNMNFPENFCHKTGKKSNGKTSMAKPIL